MTSDIIGVDKQDDRAAARLFSAALLEYASRQQPNEIGLAAYLFNAGEIIDAQQNWTLAMTTRIKMLFRGLFFLEGWRDYVLSHPFYSINTHFIARDLYDILVMFIKSMVTLILTHRDFFLHIPCLLWLSSLEVCEHLFGCGRKIQKDFTFLEWILMIPKLTVMMAGELSAKGIQAKASAHRSGYHHTWFKTDGLDLVELTTFPSDAVIQQLIKSAHIEATSMLRILGMNIKPLADNASSGSGPVTLLDAILKADEREGELFSLRPTQIEEQMTNFGI
ncbi:hypothetical protein OF83DRAFT_1166849 [Amylostereum chailletii]|nr:hypothetical protein OF83DRAFT_1166849 [Amylostereum chailletii]